MASAVGFLSNTDRAATLTRTYLDTVMDNANDSYVKAMELLNALGQVAVFDPIDTETGWTEVSTPVSSYYLGDLPVKPVLEDIPSPAVNFEYTETPYVSDLLDALKDKLLNDILEGNTGLSAAIEQEIYDRESERDILELSDTIDRIATRWSESGFVLPDGILTGMTTMADVNYQNARLDKSRKIAEDSFRVAVENTRFTTEQSVNLENVLMRFNTESNKNKIDAATAIVQAGIAIFDALIKEKLANVDLYKAEAQAYEANANAIGAISRTEIALYEAETNYNVSRAEVAIKEIELQIKQMELETTITTEIAKSIADVASRLASGALSAINAGVSLGYSGNDSNSVSDSYRDDNSYSTSVQYIHHYSED